MAYINYMHMFFDKKSNAKLGNIILEHQKSTIQVGDAKEASGSVPFFTSGDAILKWPESLAVGRNGFLNTGGNIYVKFYVGESAYSTDVWCITVKNEMADYLYLLLDSIRPELNLMFMHFHPSITSNPLTQFMVFNPRLQPDTHFRRRYVSI